MANKKSTQDLSVAWKLAFGIVSLGLVAMLFFLVYGHYGVTDMQDMKIQLDSVNAHNEKLMQENIELLQQIERLQEDKAYIEHIARREHNLVRPDETIIEIER